MKIKLFFFWFIPLCFASTLIATGQQIHLSLEAPPEFESIELLAYENPFDDNVTLLSEIERGESNKFEYVFSAPPQIRVAFKIGEFSKDLILTAGYTYSISLEVKPFQKPDSFGNVAQLVFVKVESNNKDFNYLLQVEKDIEALKAKHIKSNGKLSSDYPNELFNYWNSLLVKRVNEYEASLVNSNVFGLSLYSLQSDGSATQFKTLEKIFEQKFEYSFAGLKAMDNVYVTKLILEYFTRAPKGMSYLQFVDKSTCEIANPELQSALELAMVSNAIGRKWAEQDQVFERLKTFISTTPYIELKQYAETIQALHKSDLIGKRITDFPVVSLKGDTIRFNHFKGKYLLLDFWATWCGPCVKSMRKLPEIKAELNGKLEVLCITFEQDRDRVARFVERNNYQDKLNFGLPLNKKLMDSYFDIRAIPLYYLVDVEGVIVDKAIGEPFDMLKKHLN